MKKIFAAFFAIFLTAGAFSLAESDQFRWTGRLAAGDTLGVHGVNGDVEAFLAAGEEAEIIAYKRGRRSDPSSVRIEVVEHAEGVTVCAVYPSRRSGRNICGPDGLENSNVQDNDVEVRFEVRVPSQVHFNGTTVNGGVEAEGLEGNVRASAVNGSIHLSTTGWAEARTVNGSIEAEMGAADWEGLLEFHTVNGGIALSFPPNLQTEFRAESLNGSIRSDFDWTVTGGKEQRWGWGKRKLRGHIGAKSTRSLELETVNGDIKIRRGRY